MRENRIFKHGHAKGRLCMMILAILIISLGLAGSVFADEKSLSQVSGSFKNSDKVGGWEFDATDGVTYTPYSKTEELPNGNMGVTIYSAPEYIKEDGQLKHKTEANSLKGYYEPFRISDDYVNDFYYVDWNWDSITLKPIVKDSGELNKDIPIKVNGVPKFTVSVSSMDVEQINSITLKASDYGLDTWLGNNWTFGAHSTTDTIVPVDSNASFKDTYIARGEWPSNSYDDDNYGGQDKLYLSRRSGTSDNLTQMPLINIDLDGFIGEEKEIMNSTISIYIEEIIGNINIYFNNLNSNFTEGTGIGADHTRANWLYPNDSAAETWAYNMIGNENDLKPAYIGDSLLITDQISSATPNYYYDFELNNVSVTDKYEENGEFNIYINISRVALGAGTHFLKGQSIESGNPWNLFVEYRIAGNNTAPYFQEYASLTPELNANADDNLICTFTPKDLTTSELIAYVDWYKNGVLTVQNEKNVTEGVSANFILDNANTSGSESWDCAVRLSDSEFYSNWSNSSVTEIYPTLVNEEVIAPEWNHYQDDVQCNFTPIGNESSLTAYVHWYKDGIFRSDLNENKAVSNNTLSNFILSQTETAFSETWICEVQISNGIDESNWFNSSEIDITNSRTTYGNHTITHDLIVQGMTYLEATFSNLVESVLHWVLLTEIKETEIVGGIMAERLNDEPKLFMAFGNRTSEEYATFGVEGENTFLGLTDTDRTTFTCSGAREGYLIYDGSTKKAYVCDGTSWNALY